MTSAIAFDSVVWLPNALILTAILLAITYFVWRAKGLTAGVRMFGVSMLPLGLYFVGIWGLLWHVGLRISYFLTGFILHPTVWLGLIMTAVALVLIIVPGRLRRLANKADPESTKAAKPANKARGAKRGSSTSVAKKSDNDADEDLGDVADILKRHGID